ncbi:MAG TPA: sigma-70 family RNA polymerase sigma factor [Terriglobia bacterium]|nr:sigma-70 family RNA polymerase sigma factor [Terriglobia bacterium]
MAESAENDDDEIQICLKQKRYSDAFELLLSRYRNKMIRLAYSMLGDLALAEDTAQDAGVRIWRALPAYRGESSISTWVYAITRNTSLSALASMKRRSTRVPRSSDDPELRRITENIPVQEEHSGPDLSGVLQQLPDNHRQAVMLFYMEDKSYGEVAAMMDLPIGTVRTYLHRAKKALAAGLLEDKLRRVQP